MEETEENGMELVEETRSGIRMKLKIAGTNRGGNWKWNGKEFMKLIMPETGKELERNCKANGKELMIQTRNVQKVPFNSQFGTIHS